MALESIFGLPVGLVGLRRVLLIAPALALVLSQPAAAGEHRYGDVVIQVLPDLPQSTTHGYHEFPFQVTNESPAASRRVTLMGPESFQAGIGLHSLRALEHTVTVGPRSSVRLALMQPPVPTFGNGLRVTVDGRPQREIIPWSSGHPEYRIGRAGRHSAARPERSHRVLISQRLTEEDFPPHTPEEYWVFRAVTSIDAWSSNWLAYSGYDGVVTTAGELAAAPAGVVETLWHYVETGGTLLVLGRLEPGILALPYPTPEAANRYLIEAGLEVDYAGFGEVLVAARATGVSDLTEPQFERVKQAWQRSRTIWDRARQPSAAHRQHPVADDVEIPVRGLFLVVLVFSVLIGPVNLAILTRRGKRMWLLWTIPAASILTCAVVVLYVLAGEGLVRFRRTEGLTLLDQRARRATTLGWTGFYATLTPGDGLRFEVDTEVSPVLSWAYGQQDSSARVVEWSDRQHLIRGWLRARLPSYFIIRKSEPRRERISLRRRAGGMLEAVNGLGVDLDLLCVADAGGRLFVSEPLTAGAAGRLEATGETAAGGPGVLRELYRGDLASRLLRIQREPGGYLRAGTYVAVARASPFIEAGLSDLDREILKTVIYGIFEDDTFLSDTVLSDTVLSDIVLSDIVLGDPETSPRRGADQT